MAFVRTAIDLLSGTPIVDPAGSGAWLFPFAVRETWTDATIPVTEYRYQGAVRVNFTFVGIGGSVWGKVIAPASYLGDLNNAEKTYTLYSGHSVAGGSITAEAAPNVFWIRTIGAGKAAVLFPDAGATVNVVVDSTGPVLQNTGPVPGCELLDFNLAPSDEVYQPRMAYASYEQALGGPSSHTPPTVTLVSPANLSSINVDTPIVVDVTDPDGFTALILVAEFPALELADVIHDGAGFKPAYALHSTRTAITNGFRFSLLRRAAWPGSPTFTAHPVDVFGAGSV